MKISEKTELLLFQLYLLWMGGCLDDADYLMDRLKRIIEAIEHEQVNEAVKNPVY